MSPGDANPVESSSSPANTIQEAVPRDAERKGLVHETGSGRAMDRAIEIAKRLSSRTPESLGYIKRLVRNATDTPLAQGLLLSEISF